ncbi:MAG: amidohydrolase family protein [Deltaproteobacteria bacterium]|nr:amidohydrolase family protein [Deltaproteobacteria bacterium]
MKIDVHTHVFPPPFRQERSRYFSGEPAFRTLYDSPRARLAGVSELLQHMDEAGIDKAVIFGFPWEDADRVRRHNDYVLDAVHRYPGRLVGLGCFSPLLREAAKETERCLNAGLAGVGELAVYGDGLTAEISDMLKEVMAITLDRDAIVLLHTNEPVGHQYPGKTPMTLGQIYGFIKRYSSNRIILAHWGGGLPFYALMKREVKGALENVWFDTAASPYLYDPEIYPVVGSIVGFEKILLGSDYPLLGPSRYFEEMEKAGLSGEEFDQVSGNNAALLLHLEE